MEWNGKMRKIAYSENTLDKFTQKELLKICKYYDIQVLPSYSKTKLKKMIMEYSPPELIRQTYRPKHDNHGYDNYDYNQFFPVEPIKSEIKKSARIQRIENEKEK
jgi:hypothetical protein